MNGSPGYRQDVVEEEAGNQGKLGYSYMYPVFFPLVIDGRKREAYDARQDGTMFARLQQLIKH